MPRSRPLRPAGRRWLLVLALLGMAVIALAAGLRHAGRWLVVADRLEEAPVVVPLAGDAPFRAVEAARLLQQGWAAEIWLTRATVPVREAALARFGIDLVADDTHNAQVLARLGVPPGAVRVLEDRVETTPQELSLIAREARRRGVERVLLVTSRTHTRRTRATWDRVVGSHPRAIVRPAAEDGLDLDRWWRRKRDAKLVVLEWLGLVNVWLGLPVRGEGE